MKTVGFDKSKSFLLYVLENVSSIYELDTSKHKFDVVADLRKNYGRVMTRMEFDAGTDFYSIEKTLSDIRFIR